MLALFTINCGGEDLVGPDGLPVVSASPSPLPSPSPSPIVTYDRTLIFRATAPSDFNWILSANPVLQTDQLCSLNGIPQTCPYSPGIWNWHFSGSAFCLPQGDIFAPALRIQCFVPGIFDVTVTPPKGPQGRAVFQVLDGE